MVWRYEKATITSSTPMASEIGHASASAPVPAIASPSRISSVAYATDESASEEKTASATGFESL